MGGVGCSQDFLQQREGALVPRDPVGHPSACAEFGTVFDVPVVGMDQGLGIAMAWVPVEGLADLGR